VIDLSDDNFDAYIKEVDLVLESIQAQNIPKILVFNKIDQNYNPENFLHLQKDSFCYVSAKTGYGIETLKKIISEKIFEDYKLTTIELSSSQGEIRSSIYENCNVIEEVYAESGYVMIKFTATLSYIKYLSKKGLIEGKVKKTTKKTQDIYKTG
jgi:GTP-binding protein HflX